MAKKAPAKKPLPSVRLTLAERRAALQKKREEQLKEFSEPRTPPVAPGDLLDITVIEKKTVAEWAKLIAEAEDKAADMKGKGPAILDMTGFPGWSVWAVSAWKARGSPTAKGLHEKAIQDLLDKAASEEKWAKLDEEEASKIAPDKAKRKLAYAQKRREKAVALRAEAEVLKLKKVA